MADFSMKEGDYYPSMTATLTDANGPIDLSSVSTVYFAFGPSGFAGPNRRAAATIVDAAGGRVQYDWTAADVAAMTVGAWIGEWQIDYNGTPDILTVPNDTYITWDILQDLKS